MSARLPALQLLDLADALAAAERVLRHPTSNVQRVSVSEILTLATLARQYVALAELAARNLRGLDPDPARLADHLRAAGFLLPTPEKA